MCTTNTTPAPVRSLLAALLAASPRASSAALSVEVGDSDGDHGTELTSAAVVTVTFDNGCVWRYGCGVRFGEGFGVSDDDLADEVGDDGAKVWGDLGAVADGAPAALRGVDGAGPWTITRAELGAPQAPAPVETVAVPAAVVWEFFAASAELRAAHASRSPWGAADGRYGVARRALYVALGEAVGDDGHAAA